MPSRLEAGGSPLPWGVAGDAREVTRKSERWTEGHPFLQRTKKGSLSGTQDKDKADYTTVGEIKLFSFWLLVHAWVPCEHSACAVPRDRPSCLVFNSFVILKSVVINTIKGRILFVGKLLYACIWLLFQLCAWKKCYSVWQIIDIEDARNNWVIFKWMRLYVGFFIGYFSQSDFRY